MPLQLIIAGYTLCVLAAIAGCGGIIHSGHGSRKLAWLIFGLLSALLGILLLASRPFLSPLFTDVLANEAILLVFVFFHQAIAAILESSQKYLGASMFMVGAQFVLYLNYTYSVPSLRARILIRTATVSIQCALTVFILFRHRGQLLRHARLFVAWICTAFLLLQISRLFATVIWHPVLRMNHLGSVQAFYASFGFVFGLVEAISITWLGMSAQRDNLHLMATTDGLSGLMNRRTFDQVLQREIEYAGRRNVPVALLMIDIDHFKKVNDQYGHLMGDEVIRRISRLLSLNTRTMDAVARYGGEEFTMILRDIQLAQAESIAERLRMQIEALAGLPEPLRVTVSIGIAVACPGDTIATLLKRSDHALYLSKRTGRNRVCTQYA
ncbi:MAG TPA: GGDEF domain-containing protein [Acidobacteriaceae bacterium]|nr:GGDEF domain-containing protein [Acidobacteriaceae bacterium]